MPYKKKEDKAAQMREYRKSRTHKRLAESIYEVISTTKFPKIEARRKELYKKVDDWYQKRYDAIVEEGRRIAHGPEPFNVEQLIMNSLNLLVKAKQWVQIGKALVNEDIEKVLKQGIQNVLGEASPGTTLYKALAGNKHAEQSYLKGFRSRWKRREVEKKPDLPSDLEKHVQEARKKVPSIQKMYEDQMRKWPGGWSSSGGKTMTEDKYKNMSDSEVREAKKCEMASDLRKKREKLMKSLEKTVDTPETRPDKLAAVKVDLIQLFIQKEGLSYKHAEEKAQETIDKKLGKKLGTSVEKMFKALMEKKKKHWLDRYVV